MKGTVAVFGDIDGREIAAFLRDGRVEDLLVDPPDNRICPGAIYRATAKRLLKGLGGAILDTPDGPVFLRNAKGAGQGKSMLVQAISFAETGKATPVTTKLVLKSRYCLATPGAPGLNISRDIRDAERRVELRGLLDDLRRDDIGLVVRSASVSADDEEIREDSENTLNLAQSVISEGEDGEAQLLVDAPNAATLGWREWEIPEVTATAADDLEHYGVLDALDAAMQPFERLAGSAHLFVEATKALVAVDVNTGGDTSPAAAIKANMSAAEALPRALRLRGLGGQVVVDFAPMPKKERRNLEGALRAAFRTDPIETSLVGWTSLGLFEIQRKRERIPLAEALDGVKL